MKTTPLKERLLRYMLKHHSAWIPKGEIQRVVAAYTTFSPENAGRRLRELQEEGLLEVKIIRGHAWYSARDNGKLSADTITSSTIDARVIKSGKAFQ